MRRDCTPCLIDQSHRHLPLKRVHFGDKQIAESFLQETIHESPCFLPVDRLDSDFFPLVSIGREIASIDNLLISPTGKLTLVETKLWRNPQATREVIAQIMDYASKLWGMDFDEFQNLARSALSPAPLKNKSLHELVREAFPDQVLGEADFHDEVQKGLNDAEFMLLIVGDGIHENLEGMTDRLFQPQMHFKFGLIEVQIYESAAIPHRLVIPSLVAHSTELRRTVVKIEGGGKATVVVDNIKHGSHTPFYRKPRNLYNTDQAVCGGRGCVRACMISLENRGVLQNKFVSKFRRRKPWSVDWSDFEGLPEGTPIRWTW